MSKLLVFLAVAFMSPVVSAQYDEVMSGHGGCPVARFQDVTERGGKVICQITYLLRSGRGGNMVTVPDFPTPTSNVYEACRAAHLACIDGCVNAVYSCRVAR